MTTISKRVTGAVQSSASKRVVGDITASATERVFTQGAIAGTIGNDPWGGTWGLTWGNTWRTSQPPIPASPSVSATERVTI